MKRWILGFVTVVALCGIGVTSASAQGYGWPYGGYGYSSYYGGGYGGYGNSCGYGSYGGYYNQGHLHYHPGSLQRHRNHLHYVPGHYDYHPPGFPY